MVVNAQKPTGRLAVRPVRRASKDGSALCIIAKADAVKELMPVKSNKSSIRWTGCDARLAPLLLPQQLRQWRPPTRNKLGSQRYPAALCANPSKITELKGRPDREHREENGHQPRPSAHAHHCGAEER